MYQKLRPLVLRPPLSGLPKKQALTSGTSSVAHSALSGAVRAHTLPPVVRALMAQIHRATQEVGPVGPTVLRHIPKQLAATLASLAHPTGVNKFVAGVLRADPVRAQGTLDDLSRGTAATPALITREDAIALRQGLQASVKGASPVPLITILAQLDPAVAQAILNRREVFIEAFLNSWSHQLKVQAMRSKKAAILAARLRLEAARNEAAHNQLAYASGRVNQNHWAIERQAQQTLLEHARAQLNLLKQSFTVLNTVRRLAGIDSLGQATVGATHAKSTAHVDASLTRLQMAADNFNRYLGAQHEAPTLDALQAPMDFIGPARGMRLSRN